jgi:mannuronan 5-epimerase
VDKDSSGNSVHDNTIIDIADPEDALGIEEGAQEQNSLYSNTIINSSSE